VADGSAGEGGGEAAAPAVGVGPGVAHVAVHDGRPGRVRERGALEEPERRERRVVGVVPRQVVDVPLRRHFSPSNAAAGCPHLSLLLDDVDLAESRTNGGALRLAA
jgi:hypothetical protein